MQLTFTSRYVSQNAATHAREEVSSRAELLRDQVASLEARLGVPYVSDSSTTG